MVVFAGSVVAGVVDVAAGVVSVGLVSAFLSSFFSSFFPLRAAFNFSHKFLSALGAITRMRLRFSYRSIVCVRVRPILIASLLRESPDKDVGMCDEEKG